MNKRGYWLTCCGMAILSMSDASRAADPVSTKPPTEDGAAVLTEIVVTATRRPTLLEETPIAITALSGAALDRQHIQDFTDIAITAPSLVFTALSRQEAYPSIRGTTVGNDAPGSDLGVSIFIDDIPTTGVGDDDPNLFDIQSIELLRGPQGTLFGRNVTGGALVVHTLAPDFTPHQKVELTYGNYNLAEARGYVTGPFIDSELAGKFTFDVRRQDGIINNVYLNNTTDSTKLWGTRGQLLWTPSDDLRVLVGADYNSDTSPYKVQQLIGNFQPSSFPPLSYGPSNTNQAMFPSGDSKTSGGLIRADYSLPAVVLTSITGYRHADSTDFFSTSAEQFNEILQNYHVGADQETEEIHVSSPSGSQRLSWVTGLFFLNSNRDGLKHYTLNVQPTVLVGVAVPPYDALQFTADNNQHVHARSYAVFGDATYSFAPEWKISVGGRYTIEEKRGHSEVYDTSGESPNLAAEYSHRWSDFNPKATLSYQPGTKLLAYATIASGFKSGGYDTSATTDQGLATPFEPEKVWSYELGVKWTALDDRLVVNAAAYYAKYTELQVQEFQNLQYVTSNAGQAYIPGFELETTFNALPWLTLMGNYSYMNAKYTQYVQGDGAVFTDNQIPFDVKFHYTLGADVHFVSPQLGGGEIRIGGDVTYQGKKYFENENNDYSFITDNTKITGLVNVHANWTSANQAWQVSLWANNLNNKRYIINATELTAFYATPAEFFAADANGNAVNRMYVGDWNTPRMYGISFTYKH
jgi:iron complex outermembrane receptor protein